MVDLPTMAYVVRSTPERWEIRESHTTAAGPRSRTLATFRELTPDVTKRAQRRADKLVPAAALRLAARRAGAVVTPPIGDRAAGELIAELAAGRRPRPELTHLLIDALEHAPPSTASSNARAAAAWIGATPKKRGEALRDLLLLVDRLPQRERPRQSSFPRIVSRPA